MSFEERHTAWVDGAMDEAERAAFERELPDVGEATRERDGWSTLRERMREAVPSANLAHGDFVNSQVLAEIERDRPGVRREAERGGLFPVTRLLWAGSFLAVVAAVLTGLWMTGDAGARAEAQFVTRVIEAESRDPAAEAYVFLAPGGRGSVLWVEGAGYIAPTERL
jgi:hypothetical protein